ncbi:Crp/Fnr family transcriptional regulator [Aliiroseovarius sp. KMU-50]|uniref:Crp/Fnr family transcriptional regulator n=1 Tax=Aliiroseovarius salicola TaxID=3009082 RepID=A0ABT4W4Y4_9RHOB|nr:Crp/Fnr family transcriptional regulator [Aliiroseovarius sp. KMU-50]MDA5095580.1 Crp/Fnr family transcriptional regulator [Aliiroseovarius sp. KMU-50]
MAKVDLSSFQWFRGFGEEDLARVQRRLRPATYDQGQLVIDRADPSNDVYLVVKGRALAVHWTNDGREIVFSRIPAGDAFGELSAIDGSQRSLSIYAQTKTVMWILPQKDFLSLIDMHPGFRHTILVSLTDRIRAITMRCNELTSFSVVDRVRSHLLRLALQEGVLSEGGVLKDMPTHAELGNTLGANREAVSRAISSLKKAGIIETGRRQIRILNPQALAELSDP